jgi:hypothetical protein
LWFGRRLGDLGGVTGVHNVMVQITLLTVALLAFGTLATAAGAPPAQKPLAAGDVFPRLEAEFLTGRKAVLPDAAAGKVALLMMGFTYDSRVAVEAWAGRFGDEFGSSKDVTFFEVPVIGGMGWMAKWFIDSGMRRGTPAAMHENVITVYGGVDRWKTAMGFTKAQEDDAYLALLGPDGRVRWLHRGPFSEDAMSALRAAVGDARAAATPR